MGEMPLLPPREHDHVLFSQLLAMDGGFKKSLEN